MSNFIAIARVRRIVVPFLRRLRWIQLGVFALLAVPGLTQTRTIRGQVMDSASHAPLQNVSITVRNSNKGVLSDASGSFVLVVGPKAKTIEVSILGYQPQVFLLTDEPEQELFVILSKSYTTLGGVVINARKGKYTNKNNPAVELIRMVIARKQENGPTAYGHTSFRQYEQTQMFTEGPWVRATQNFALKKFKFIFENVDSTLVPGKKLNSVYLQEVLSDNYYRREPEKRKKVVMAQKTVNYGEYVDMRGVSDALKYILNDINIYDNNISAFTLQFVSPIADMAPTFYMYFIRDTTVVDGSRIVRLHFMPRNSEDLLFQGDLYVNLDRNYAVTRVELNVNKHSNINYVRDIRLNQRFEQGPGNHFYLSESDLLASFSPFPRTKVPGLYGERKFSITQFSDTVVPDLRLHGLPVDSLPLSSHQPVYYWDENRPAPLTESQVRTYQNADSLVKMKSYKTLMDLSTLYFVGYKSAGKFDIGPIRTFYSFNNVEGQRLQFGGRSNYRMSRKIYLEGYLGYGFRDAQFKYKMTASYSFNKKSIYSYPFNYIQASYMHDLKNPGQENIFSSGNSFLSSFTRGYTSNWLYTDIFRLSYVKEFASHFSYILGTEYWKQQPAGSLVYVKQPTPVKMDTIPQITTGEFFVSLRWAPREQFFENKMGRRNIANKYPVISLQYTKGIQGLYGGEYNYDALHLDVYKRVFMSPLGFSDISLGAGYLFGTLPFPLLTIPAANRSYFYSYISYNLLNVQEFVMDHYGSLFIDHYFNGFFFNKIPLLKKLRLREVIAGKILYGGLRSENNPAHNPDQMLFPTTNGVTSTYGLGPQPYIEASVGIYNIFSFLRIDLIKRFTYLDHPGISKWGVLFSSNFNF